MRFKVFGLAVAVGTLVLATAPARADQEFRIETDYGPVHLSVDHATGRVHGRAPKYNEDLLGELGPEGGIRGVWVQPQDDQHACRHPIRGTWYWGHFYFPPPDGGVVRGSWSYCDGPASQGWNGRVSASWEARRPHWNGNGYGGPGFYRE